MSAVRYRWLGVALFSVCSRGGYSFYNDGFSAGFFNFFFSRFGELGRCNIESGAQFAIAEDLEGTAALANEAGLDEDIEVNFGDAFEGSQIADIDGAPDLAEFSIIEAALRQLTVERDVTGFKAGTLAGAGACFLTFMATTGCFTVAVTAATTYTLDRTVFALAFN